MPERLVLSRPQANPEVLGPEALLESLGCGVVVTAPNGVIRLINGEAAGWIGQSPVAVVGGSYRAWADQLHEVFLILSSEDPQAGVKLSERLETRGTPKRRILREVRALADGGEVETLIDLSGELRIDRDLH